jgi:hypothetical protein
MDTIKQLMTRREVIESWSKSDKYLDYYVCPNCRDILRKVTETHYACHNHCCSSDGQLVEATGSNMGDKKHV